MISHHQKIIIFAAAFGTGLGLQLNAPVFSEDPAYVKDRKRYAEEFKQKSPLEFLDSLKSPSLLRQYPPQNCILYSVQNWIKDDDVKVLASKLNSKVPCAGVLAGLHSDGFERPSTEGEQALFLIYGAYYNLYPKVWLSHCRYLNTVVGLDEIKRFLDSKSIKYPPISTWACLGKTEKKKKKKKKGSVGKKHF